jgi:phenylacetate-CoA ligase
VAGSKYVNLVHLLRNERRSLDELIYHQSIALKNLVNHAYSTVPFYKKLYDVKGLNPQDIQSIEDITKIPIIDKQLLVQNSFDKLISNKYKLNNLIPVKTAGSNGKPFLFYIDHAFDQFRKAQFLRPYFTNGMRPWNSTITFSIYDLLPPKKWYQYLGILRENKIHPGLTVYEQIKIIQNNKPSIIRGYGSALNLLAVKIIENNIPVPKQRFIFTDSELLMPESRTNIEKAFESNVIDIYGTFETDNIAYECNHHEGYHITIDSVIMEFLDNGKPVKPNEEGEIVVTVLNNFAFPFIRYNLYDIGSYSQKPCSCVRTFPLMNTIYGRANDYMIRSDGNRLSYTGIAHFDKLAPNVREYQIVQEDIDFFNVYVVPGIDYDNHGEKIIVPKIKKFFPNARIAVNVVPKIEREQSGKFKAFKSKVNA